MNIRCQLPCAAAILVLHLLSQRTLAYFDGDVNSCEAPALDIPDHVAGTKRSITAKDLMTLRELGGANGTGLSLSPDGKYIAFELHQADVEANDYNVAWFIASVARAGDPINVGDAGDAILFRSSEENGRIGGAWIGSYAKWAPDSRGIAYRKLDDRQVQIWWSSYDGAEQRKLTHNAADVEEFYWSRDGSKLFFVVDATRDKLHKVATSRYSDGYVFDYETDWSTIDARPFYPPYALIGGQPAVWVLDLANEVERRASESEIAEYRQLAEPERTTLPSPRARAVASTTDGTVHAWLTPISEKKQGRSPPMTLFALTPNGDEVRCEAPECTGIFDLTRPLRDGIHWVAEDGVVLFVRKTGKGYSKRALYGWRVGDDSVREILSTDDWITDCSVVDGQAICFRETPTQPRTIVAIDLAGGSIKTLIDPNPGFKNFVLGDVELIEWKNSYGHETFGYLVEPVHREPGRRYPLILVGYRAHTALRGGVGNEYPVHLLSANGFAVLVYERPTNHEAEETVVDPIDWSKANWGPDLFDYRTPLASFKAIIGILADRGLIDPARVGVTGLSNGVGHVNYALIESDLFSAAITSSSDFGPSNYFLVGSSDPTFRQHRRAIGLGRYGSAEGFLWKHISLAINAKRVRAPLLVNAADSEHPRALEEVVTLIEHGKPVEMIVYPDEAHIKWQPAHRAAIYERNVDWFNFWLRSVEDPSPDKADQYIRWRELANLLAEQSK